MIACNMTEDVENQVVSKKLFHATIDDESTRTFVDEKIRLRWTEGDLISLFEGTTRNKKYKFLGETGDNAGDFEDITTGFGSGNDIDRYYAIYPYSSSTKLHEDGYITYTFPTEQNYAENSFGLGANPMVAVTGGLDDFDLCFRNAAGYLRLYLYGDDVAVKSIKIEGNNSEPLAGKAYITPEFGGFPTTEMDETATTSVTLNCGEGVKIGSTAESSTPFWVVLPPTTFAEGFTLTITDTNDNEFTKSFTSNVNIQRNKYISARIEVEFPISLNNQIIYTATAKVEPYQTYAYIFGANIVSNEWDKTTGEGVITFNGDVTSIGEYAFYGCSALRSITIPDSVTTIGYWSFYNCYALTSVKIGNGVTSIGESAFCYSYLKDITIPDSVTSIGSRAFSECEALTSVTIGSGVTSIGNYTFSYCDALTSVNICNGVTSIGEGAFSECYALTSITIPDSVTSIGGGAFRDCRSLTSVTIGNGVTSIRDGAFNACSSLKSFYGKYASDDNRCLICADELIAFAPAGLTTYNIPDSVTSIGDDAFRSCDALTSIAIPDCVTSIGDGAFSHCYALTSITIPDSVTEIDNSAFYECKLLSSAIIGNGVTSIGDGAFRNCDALNSFYGKYASSDNRCLIIDGKLKFFAPAGLTTYNIPDGVTSIIDYAFSYCDALTSITIPDSVTEIDSSVFGWSSSLARVYCKATTPPNINGALYDIPNLINIYVPSSSVDTYKTAKYWSLYAAKIVEYNF